MKSALVTGGADGLGAGWAKKLAGMGYCVSILDINYSKAQEVAQQIKSQGGEALAVHCDVTNHQSQEKAFAAHLARFGSGPGIAIINAGIMESGDLLWDTTDSWKKALDVNLTAAMVGVRLAVQSMVSSGIKGGVIMVVASAGGVFPMPVAPVYSTAKAGCVMLTRSLGPPLMRRHGIRICALCPQFTDTSLVRSVRRDKGAAVAEELTREVGGKLLEVSQVVDAGIALLGDESKVGECVVVLASGDLAAVKPPRLTKIELNGTLISGIADTASAPPNFPPVSIPAQGQKIVVQRISPDFRYATEVLQFPIPSPASLPPGHALIKNVYVGINASDINFTSGRYQEGKGPPKLPFDAGFEACGVVAAVAPDVKGLQVGQPIATMTYGGFSEYTIVPAKQCLPVARCTPEVVALLTSGLTASIALEQAARMGSGEKVLITAAAGGTGQFFVQLAKRAGNHVIATCGGAEKASFLKRLGADRVINYKEENVAEVLKSEYSTGVDLVVELVGGDMFKTCVNALAPRGRLVIIGAMSQYAGGWKPSTHVGLPEKLLKKSTSLVGFFLPLYASHFKRHLARLTDGLETGELHVAMDPGKFRGVRSIPDAVDRLQSGESVGKVYVQVGEVPLGIAGGVVVSKL